MLLAAGCSDEETGLPVNSKCKTNKDCADGICNNWCADPDPAAEGKPCDGHGNCKSFNCQGGFCRKGIRAAGEACITDVECRHGFCGPWGKCGGPGADGGKPDATPDAGKPDRALPDMQVPDSKVLDINVPDIKVSDIKAPDIKAPDSKVPDKMVPDINVPDMKVPDMKVPDMKVPDMLQPDTVSDCAARSISTRPGQARHV